MSAVRLPLTASTEPVNDRLLPATVATPSARGDHDGLRHEAYGGVGLPGPESGRTRDALDTQRLVRDGLRYRRRVRRAHATEASPISWAAARILGTEPGLLSDERRAAA